MYFPYHSETLIISSSLTIMMLIHNYNNSNNFPANLNRGFNQFVWMHIGFLYWAESYFMIQGSSGSYSTGIGVLLKHCRRPLAVDGVGIFFFPLLNAALVVWFGYTAEECYATIHGNTHTHTQSLTGFTGLGDLTQDRGEGHSQSEFIWASHYQFFPSTAILFLGAKLHCSLYLNWWIVVLIPYLKDILVVLKKEKALHSALQFPACTSVIKKKKNDRGNVYMNFIGINFIFQNTVF